MSKQEEESDAAHRAVWENIACLLDGIIEPCMLPILVYEDYQMILEEKRGGNKRVVVSK